MWPLGRGKKTNCQERIHVGCIYIIRISFRHGISTEANGPGDASKLSVIGLYSDTYSSFERNWPRIGGSELRSTWSISQMNEYHARREEWIKQQQLDANWMGQSWS